jgi:hypothetical protein
MVTDGAIIATSIMAMEANITAAAAMRPSMAIMPTDTMIVAEIITAKATITAKIITVSTPVAVTPVNIPADILQDIPQSMVAGIPLDIPLPHHTALSTTSNL